MNINLPFDSLERALHVFAMQGRIDLVKVLLEKDDADINAQDADGTTGLMYAADNNHPEICSLLLEYGAEINFRNHKGSTALMFACLSGNLEVAELLLKHSGSVDVCDENGCSALIYAVQNGQAQLVALLLRQRAQIDLQDVEGNTALIYAVVHRRTDIVDLLIKKGADVDMQNKDGQSAITIAAINDLPEIGKLLMTKRSELRVKRIHEMAEKAHINLTTIDEFAPNKSGFMFGGIPRSTAKLSPEHSSVIADEPSWMKKKNYGIPFSTFTGWLKQIDASELNTLGILAIEYAFPLFLIDLNEEGIENMLKRMEHGVKDFAVPQRTRRFAGDGTLPRGKYWSVSHDEKGDDGGTLTGELWAYYDTHKAGIIDIVDLTNPEAVKTHEVIVRTPIEKPKSPAFTVNFYSTNNHINPFLKSLGIDSSKPLAVYFPLRVEQHTIENVIDLRKPDTAQWFVEFFSTLTIDVTEVSKQQKSPTYIRSWPARPPLRSFADILPSLLTQERGGGLFDQAVGAWCRQHGVNGLIFPSVRNDCNVIIENSEVKSFDGWNFVDYRGSGNPKTKHFFDISDYWEKQVRIGIGLNVIKEDLPLYNVYDQVEIDSIKSGVRKGSWRVKGIIGTKRSLIEINQKEYIRSVNLQPMHTSAIADQVDIGNEHQNEIHKLINQFPREGEMKRWFKAFVLNNYWSCAKSGLALLPHIDSFEILQMFLISLQRLGEEIIMEQMAAKEILLELEPQVLAHHKDSPELNSLLALTFGIQEPNKLLTIATTNTSRCTIHYYYGARLFTLGKQKESELEFQKSVDLKGDCFEFYLAQAMLLQLKAQN